MNVCIFCGSGAGKNPVYGAVAKHLGSLLARSQSTLIYGGGNIGLMGIVADQVLADHGKVIGIIPDFLMNREVGHSGLTQLEVVGSMHERKRRMADLAEVFIAMPGGWGTLDELAEILTWKQLGLVHASIGILNANHFFDSLLDQMRTMVLEGFLHAKNLEEIKVEDDPERLLIQLGVIPVK
jgi:uncharacterized protein (TIGR00730 family)